MQTFEDEYRRMRQVGLNISNFSLVGKKLIVEGRENLVNEGGNIIVGNHIGSYKDVATLLKVCTRPIFFVANKNIFTRQDFSRLVRKHLHRHMGNFGLFLDFLINPIKFIFVDYISSRIANLGAIPVDLHHKKRLAIERCQEYVKKGRAVIALQGQGRVRPEMENPYIFPFRRGPSIISYNTYKETGQKIPVTPVAFFGTQNAWAVPCRVFVRIGEPMFITDYWENDMSATIERFRAALENRVTKMFLEIIKSR